MNGSSGYGGMCFALLVPYFIRMLEDEDKLNCLNEIDMFCLHFVFQPRINSALNAFMESWNNHSLSTVGNLTPNQIFIQGALEHNRFPHYPLTSQQQVRVLQLPQYSNPVEVPRTKFRACDRLKNTLLVTLTLSNTVMNLDVLYIAMYQT